MIDGHGDCSAPTSGDAAAVAGCPNCGQQRSGRFCAACGQNDRDYIRALPPVLSEILKETFELDSRIFRTIKPLFLRPGELPNEFSRNRRARYISPIRLYLFASLAFFFLVAVKLDLPFTDQGMIEFRDQPLQGDMEPDQLDAGIENLKAVLPPEQQRKVDDILERPGMPVGKTILHLAAHSVSAEEMANLNVWEAYWAARFIDLLEDPKAAFSQLLDTLPFCMFVILPAYSLLLMLFFRGSRRFYTEHLVFAVQLHSFAFIVFTVLMLLPEQQPVVALDAEQANGGESRGWLEELLSWTGPLTVIWVLVYHYLALRRYYGNSRMRTLLKWSALTIAYLVLLIPGFQLSLMLAMALL